MDKELFKKLLNEYLSDDLETLKEKYRKFYISEGTKVFLNEKVWVNRMKLSILFKEKLLEKGMDEKEYMEMNLCAADKIIICVAKCVTMAYNLP